MKEERMAVLTMISEGKITADEGVSLLKALSKSVDTEEKLSKAAKQIKNKVSDIAKEAEPKVKKAAADLKVKGGEVASEIGEKIKARINKAKEGSDDEGEIIEAEDLAPDTDLEYAFEYDEDEDEAEDKAEEEEKTEDTPADDGE